MVIVIHVVIALTELNALSVPYVWNILMFRVTYRMDVSSLVENLRDSWEHSFKQCFTTNILDGMEDEIV